MCNRVTLWGEQRVFAKQLSNKKQNINYCSEIPFCTVQKNSWSTNQSITLFPFTCFQSCTVSWPVVTCPMLTYVYYICSNISFFKAKFISLIKNLYWFSFSCLKKWSISLVFSANVMPHISHVYWHLPSSRDWRSAPLPVPVDSAVDSILLQSSFFFSTFFPMCEDWCLCRVLVCMKHLPHTCELVFF